MAITQLPTIDTTMTIKQIPTINMTSDSGLSIKALPEIKFGITELPVIRMELGMKPTRVHFPIHMKYAICVMGMEVLSLSTCGESMIVVEDYVPTARERCL
jgi:hypothetical protein